MGLGESNLNFRVSANRRKYIFRINMDPDSRDKTREEFGILRTLEKFRLAPGAYHLDETRTSFEDSVLILGFVEGTSLDQRPSQIRKLQVVRNLAKVVARVNSISSENIYFKIRNRGSTYESFIAQSKMHLNYVRSAGYSHKLDALIEVLDEAISSAENFVSKTEIPNVQVPCHGDPGAQNTILQSNSRICLIDWESFGIWDPAAEIARIFYGFGIEFPAERQKDFLLEYSKWRRDPSLANRIELFKSLILLDYLTWGLWHLVEIEQGRMHKAFIKATDLRKHFAYVKDCLEKCRACGLFADDENLDGFNIEKAFGYRVQRGIIDEKEP
ncbi:MAG: aminoglycoside phosphotransferase family protein [Thaumarchaeota archaeon]|nr:aminoglycoside phosphotransferase family protein [Nitrososphaerota archaeon]